MKNTFRAKYGDWALITGATSGIGKALAFEIAKKGLNIVLVARTQEKLEQVAQGIKEKHRVSTRIIQVDLLEKSGLDIILSETKNLSIGMLILSAGIENNGSFVKNDIETEVKVVELNILSTLRLTHHFAIKMEEKKRGGILFVSSLTAHMPSPLFSNYASTKSYVFNFGSSLYAELKPKGIDVSILSPGVTNTPMSLKSGINWKNSKAQIMEPTDVATEAITNFGKKLSIIPGKGNKTIAFMAKKILPITRLATENHKMMTEILPGHKI